MNIKLEHEDAIIELEYMEAVEVFSIEGAATEILRRAEIEAQRLTENQDTSTAAGVKKIKSDAYRFARLKTQLDKAGKDLVAEQRHQIKKVGAVRNRIVAELNEMRDRVRRPVTILEEVEAEILNEVSLIRGLVKPNMFLDELEVIKERLTAYKSNADERVKVAVNDELKLVSILIEKEEQAAKDKEIADKFRAMNEERELEERIEREVKERVHKRRVEVTEEEIEALVAEKINTKDTIRRLEYIRILSPFIPKTRIDNVISQLLEVSF